MKTAKDIYEQALRLLNYTNTYGELDSLNDAELSKRALAVVNQIYADLYRIEHGTDGPLRELQTMQDTPSLTARTAADIMPYGVAMLLAQSESDGDNQSLFANLYNQKRASTPRLDKRRLDALPVGCDW